MRRASLTLLACLLLAATPSVQAEENTDASFVKAVRLYEQGRLAESREIFEEIAADRRYDKESRRYLKSILSLQRKMTARDQNIVERDRILGVRRSWMPLEHRRVEGEDRSIADATKVSVHTRLHQVIPEINFTDANLRDVISYLSKISGVNMILDEDAFLRSEEGMVEVEPGQEIGTTQDPAQAVSIRLKNVPLIEVLRYILPPKGLRYRVDDYAIVVSTPAKLDSTEMETRHYQLQSGSSSFVAVRRDANVAGHREDDAGEASVTIRDVLEESGVPFPAGSKVFLDARTGVLIVRNTQGNLAEIEKILGALDVTPFQVSIEAKFVDIEEITARELGLETFLRGDAPLLLSGTAQPNLVIRDSAGSAAGGQFTGSTADNKGFSRGLRFLSDSSGSPRGNIFSLASVLTQPQLQLVLHALDQTGMANILSAPKVTTANNEQARIKVVTEIFYPTTFEVTPATTNDDGDVVTPPVVIPGGFTNRDVGISLEVTPSVGADKKAISLTLIPEVSTLSGWQDFGIAVGSNFPAIPILQPIFTSKNVTASIVIEDTETVVLGGLIKDTTTTQEDKIPVLGDVPFLGRAFRSSTESSTKRNLLIFVTAYLLTPEGDTVRDLDLAKSKIFNP